MCTVLKTSHGVHHLLCGSGTAQALDVSAALAKRQPEGELLRILHRQQPESRLHVRAVCKSKDVLSLMVSM